MKMWNRRRAAISGLLLAAVATTLGGCDLFNQGKAAVGTLVDINKGQKEEEKEVIALALKDGVPLEQLDGLMEEATKWIVETAPAIPRVKNAPRKMILARGKIRTTGRSVSDSDANAEGRRIFNRLQNFPQMRGSFQFLDREQGDGYDSIADLVASEEERTNVYTGEVSGGGATRYDPESLFLISFEFYERAQTTGEEPELRFELAAIIEWGGNMGERLATGQFTRTLVLVVENDWFSDAKAKWVVKQ